ncbi:MAG TPA: hypothetical protein VNF99_14655 [Stellaceae bacterium]|nr:hypothetical protein [Stellaceae bacterium]
MPIKREPPSNPIVAAVAIASRRRCCLCVFLKDRDETCKGQIAHLNRDPSDSKFENLVYLCLEHHDEYDSRTSQSKGLMLDEVRSYRDRLYDRNPEAKAAAFEHMTKVGTEIEPLPKASQYELLRKRFPKELAFTSKPWRYPLWQVANQPQLFAYKASNGCDGICLIERIDLPDGRIVIVCTQTEGNPGQSITNSIEELCLQVCERFEIPPNRLVWLEHYDFLTPDEWDIVNFKRRPPRSPFEDPSWTTMTPKIWRELKLRPKGKARIEAGRIDSQIEKLFEWPTEAIF